MRLTVLNESLHHGMQFKAISGEGEGIEFEKSKLEVKNDRAWEKNVTILIKKACTVSRDEYM